MHSPVWPLSMPQPMCRAFLPQLLCPPCLLSSKVAGGHVNDRDHTVVGVDICSCNRSIIYHSLAVGKCRCRPEPCRRPTVCSPASKSQNFSTRDDTELQDDCPILACKRLLCSAAERFQGCCESFIRCCESKRKGPSSSSASTSLAFVENRSQCAELSSRNCSVHHVC